MSQIPSSAHDAALQKSSSLETVLENKITVRGEDFSKTVTLDSLCSTFMRTGFQSTNVGLAIDEINRMLAWHPSPEVEAEMHESKPRHCTIFLSYTSNMISCGVRETIKFLVQHKLVHCLISTAGGIEEDFMKCLSPHYLGDFSLKGRDLRLKGINRLGNLLVPNQSYCEFEEWFNPILAKMTDEQVEQGVRWTPSKLINRLGKEIDNPDSVYYWAHKNDIPVFCPGITDGSLGDMLYFHNYKRPEFYLDLVEDIRALNDIAVRASCSGMVILGGGIIKHHTCNANLMRNGAEYSVFINTGHEFDGSDSGASPDEAVSWGKIKITANPVKVSCDASIIFPLIVSQTFLKHHLARQQKEQEQGEGKAAGGGAESATPSATEA